MRATFITLAIEDGADPDVIETRVTHGRKARNVFDGYNRRLHWERTCAEISKLRITRGPQSTTIEQPLPAGAEHEPLLFAAVAASGGNAGEKKAALGVQPRRHARGDAVISVGCDRGWPQLDRRNDALPAHRGRAPRAASMREGRLEPCQRKPR